MKDQEDYVEDESVEMEFPEENIAQSYEEYPITTNAIGYNPEKYADSEQLEHYNYYDYTNTSAAYQEYPEAINAGNISPNLEAFVNKQQQHKQYHNANSSNTERKDILLSDFLTFKAQPTRSKTTHSKPSHQGDSLEKSSKDRIVFVNKEAIDDSAKRLVDIQTFDDVDDVDDVDDTDVTELPSLDDGPGDSVPEDNKPRGTEIRFKGLELCENTSTLRTELVTLTVECAKCKTKTDMKAEKSRYGMLF